MTRAEALSRVAKLEALADPSRGGTPAECALAREKADALIKSHGLRTAAPPPKRTVPPLRPRRQAAPATAGGFDIRTGAHAPNVKVHHYNSPRDWKIEIF